MDPVIHSILVISLSLLFFAAAIGKLSDYLAFKRVLVNYRLFPRGSEVLIAPVVLILELGTGLGLLFSGTRFSATVLATVILSVYALAITINLLRGRTNIDCGCMGRSSQTISSALPIRNLVLVLTALLILVPTHNRELMWLDFVVLVAGVLALSLCYAASNQLLANAGQIGTWRNRKISEEKT